MSDLNDSTSEDGLPTKEPQPLGCLANFGSLGLAMYALLVIGLLTSSLTCGVMTMVQSWLSSYVPGSELQSGFEAAPWRINELRKWGILKQQETPALYHDHSLNIDGSSGCLVMDDHLVLWADKKETLRLTIPGATVESSDTLVRLRQGTEQIECPFYPGDGADRLAAMLKTDAGIGSQLPPSPPEDVPNGE